VRLLASLVLLVGFAPAAWADEGINAPGRTGSITSELLSLGGCVVLLALANRGRGRR
jgi:hypothetical protein